MSSAAPPRGDRQPFALGAMKRRPDFHGHKLAAARCE
jgi:hypothetical protein